MTKAASPAPPMQRGCQAGRRRYGPRPIAMLSAWSVCCCLLLSALPAGAVIIYRKGQDEPIRGFLIQESASTVTVRIPQDNHNTRDLILSRSSIDELIRAYSPERLEALQQDQPQKYREYAEELVEPSQDPEARAMAIRLFLLAAYLDPQRLGKGSLLAMADLARTAREERRFRAMVYLLDPRHDRSELKQTRASTDLESQLDDRERNRLLRGLRLLRTGSKRQAHGLARNPEFRRLLTEATSLAPEQYEEEAQNRRDLIPSKLLRKLLEAELKLRGSEAAGGASAERRPWALISRPELLETVTMPRLETITEFDPRKCHYRDGEWVEPAVP